MKRIPPSRKMRQEIEEVLSGWEETGHPLDTFVRLGARYMLQVALEQEVEEFLGRGHYRRDSRKQEGWCNGYEPGKVKTVDGLLEVALPQSWKPKRYGNALCGVRRLKLNRAEYRAVALPRYTAVTISR